MVLTIEGGENMAIKIPPVTNEEWLECNEWNRKMVDKFLKQQHLSDKTLKQYTSALKIFVRYVKDEFDNRPVHKLKARHALDYQNHLMSLDLSSNAVKFKRSTVSSFCNYIELYYGEDYPEFRNIFNKAIPNPPKQLVREKNIVTKEDIEKLVSELEKQGQYQMIAYFLLSYSTGARRAEIAQMKKEFFEMPKAKNKDFYATPTVRGKGKGKVGKPIQLKYSEEARQAVLKWLEIRGEDDNPYVFVRKFKNGETNKLSPDAFNAWFTSKFNPILGYKLTPHALRRSRATHLVVDEGKDINKAKVLLNHNSTETTSIYVMKDESDELDDIF